MEQETDSESQTSQTQPPPSPSTKGRRNAGVEIDLSKARYPTSRNGPIIAGLIPAPSSDYPRFVWIDGILHRDESLDYKPYQRISKIPGMDFLCYKTSLFNALNEFRKYFPNQFSFYPRTFEIPNEFLEFQREHMTYTGRSNAPPSWVIKPKNSCCGAGIQIVQSTTEAQRFCQPGVIQLYVRPYLINNRKFDFRFYLLISCLDPLYLFIYNEGIARFCSEDYSSPSKANKSIAFMHLTNTAVNVENKAASAETFTKKATEVFDMIMKRDRRGVLLKERINDCCRGTIIGLLPKMLAILPQKRLVPSLAQRSEKRKEISEDDKMKIEESELPPLVPVQIHSYPPLPLKKRFWHILGIDCILDCSLNPQILELNDRPSLCVTVPFEADLKEGLIRDAFLHISPDGESFEDPSSGWELIFPVPENHPAFSKWREAYSVARKPRPNGELDVIASELPRARTIYERVPLFEKEKKKKKSGKKKGRKKKNRERSPSPDVTA